MRARGRRFRRHWRWGSRAEDYPPGAARILRNSLTRISPQELPDREWNEPSGGITRILRLATMRAPRNKRADVSDIDERLLTGEEVILKTAKHWFAPAADSKWAVLMIVGAVLLAWIQPDASDGILGF